MSTTTNHDRTIKKMMSRLQRQLTSNGSEFLDDEELLRFLLLHACSCDDAKTTTKFLIKRFGGLASIMSANLEPISEPGRLCLHAFALLKAVREVTHRVAREEVLDRPVISSWENVLRYCRTVMARERIEQLRLLFLDAKNHLIADEVQQRGTVDHTPVYPREIAKRALELDATGVIMVHNHPSGDPTPSATDIEITDRVRAATAAIDVTLHDHIVIGRGGHSSFRSLGLL